MEKVVRDGKVAVLYSPGFGAGWWSWNQEVPALLFCPAIVAWVEQGQPGGVDQLKTLVEPLGPDIYVGRSTQLKIAWLPKGTCFLVEEYDGSESIVWEESDGWLTA